MAGFIKAHDIALNNYDFDTIVAGHLTRLGTRDDVMVQKEFVSDLEKAAGKANQEVLFSKIASQVGRFDNPWLIFSKYIDAVNEDCVNNMLPKWENRLGRHSSSCRLTALLWLNLGELILPVYTHYFKTVSSYTNE